MGLSLEDLQVWGGAGESGRWGQGFSKGDLGNECTSPPLNCPSGLVYVTARFRTVLEERAREERNGAGKPTALTDQEETPLPGGPG